MSAIFLPLDYAIELSVNTVGMPISLLNLFLIGRTSLIHPNLKFILLYQSACILLRALCRFAICVGYFGRFNLANSVYFLYELSIYNRNFLVHVLIIERVLATILAKGYEKRWRNWKFTLFWSPLVFLAGLYNVQPQGVSGGQMLNLLTTSVLFVLGLFELAVFFGLCRCNKKRYLRHQEQKRQSSHSLTERYQLSENIRNGRQLTPALLLHIFNIFTGMVLLYWAFFGWPGGRYAAAVVTNLNSVCGLLIEVTMITFHPFLKRDLKAMLRRLIRAVNTRGGRVQDAQTAASNEQRPPSEEIALQDVITGRRRIVDSPGLDKHFLMLKAAWK